MSSLSEAYSSPHYQVADKLNWHQSDCVVVIESKLFVFFLEKLNQEILNSVNEKFTWLD